MKQDSRDDFLRIKTRSNVGLLIATKMEVPNIFRSMSSVYPIGDSEIHMVVSGMGQKKARRAAEYLCRESHPDYLMMLGVCGGTRDDLDIGHIIIADRVIYGREEIELDSIYWDNVVEALQDMQYHKGTFQTFDRPVLSRGKVSKDTLAVDMEAFAVADIGRNYGVPTVVIKAVSDVVPQRIGVHTLQNLINFRRYITRAKVQLDTFAERYFV